MDERMEFLDDFDLLMENASHLRIHGDTKFAQPVGDGCSGWGHNCSGREQQPESAIQVPGLGFLAFGPLVVARVRTE